MQGAAVAIYLSLLGVAALFQLALALGAPWGEWAMGGKFPGRLPQPMRWAAVAQMVVLLGFAVSGLSKAGYGFTAIAPVADVAMWVAVAFFVLGSIMNLMTPSKRERNLWAPVNLLLLASSLVLALGIG